ncbi:centrosomin-like isoform X2 [Homalodisca vitripennis]|nr:centrosomin-like isoform X2 [Homalodisca vitripennis]
MDHGIENTIIDYENSTLPSQLDDTNQFTFDGRQIPFSPTSPGKRSPGRPRTMKEYEEDLVNLKRENFNLKVRIYFIEQNRIDPNLPKDVDELRGLFTDLKVEHELTKKDLSSKEDLLINTYKALDVQKQQLEAMNNDFDALKTEHEQEKLELQTKIDALEKELKDSYAKFMETSIHLDDTNAMYAMTFGLDKKATESKQPNPSEIKIKELESELAKERERVSVLEDMINVLQAKSAKDKGSLEQVHQQVCSLAEELKEAVRVKNVYHKMVKDAHEQLKTKSESMEREMAMKEMELENKRRQLKNVQRNLDLVTRASQEKQEQAVNISTQTEFENNAQSIFLQNVGLKQEVRKLQRQIEERSTPRSSRERSTGRRSSDLDREQARQLRQANDKLEELAKEIKVLKEREAKSSKGYRLQDAESFIQALVKENKLLKREVEELKAANRKLSDRRADFVKEEVVREIEDLRKMTSDKDVLIQELNYKIQELKEVIIEKECTLQEYKMKLESIPHSSDSANGKTESDLKSSVCNSNNEEQEKQSLVMELEEKNKEVECLKKELRKRTFNLQGLVNTELWDKNREIEKLNKVCERRQLEVLALKKQLRDFQVQDKVTTLVAPMSLQNSGIFLEDKENLQPRSDTKDLLQQLAEENRQLSKKVEELQARLLNTPERDADSLLVQTLRAERDQADKLRKEAVNACVLLTTRLQELADFLDSLLPSLCGKKRRVVQQAVERSRELSRSLSIAAEESTLHHCSAWTELQPSLYVPLLPDISTVDFWSGDECQEAFSDGEEVAKLKSQVETLTEEVKQRDGEIARFQSEKSFGDNFLKSAFGNNEQQFMDNTESRIIEETEFCGNIADITEGSLVETSDQNQPTKLNPEVRSANIGKITLTSKKKSVKSSQTPVSLEGTVKHHDGLSEYETWSEPDRDVSYARMGLKEDPTNMTKSMPNNFGDTSETADSAQKSPSSRRGSEIQRLQRKIRNLEQVNEALRSELVILHQLTPSALSRQDKTTSIELSRQSQFCVPSHLLEEIRHQREKLEASLFHNDYIRRQLESTDPSLRRNQGDDQENASLARLKEVTTQLELAESELSELKSEKENWNKQVNLLQTTLQQNSSELIEKQRALLELEDKTAQRIKEVEEVFSKKCAQSEQKCLQLEQKWLDLRNEKDELSAKMLESNQHVNKLLADVERYEQEGIKNKKLQEDLNIQIQQISQQKEDLKRIVAEQEQLLADAERERQELATQLIARDRQVSELQKRLSCLELSSGELERALRSQLDLALDQCAQFEARVRDLDSSNKRRDESSAVVEELQRRLDAARFAHSEAVLQYTRVANENIKLQQELRRRQHEPNQVAIVERIKCELERRVAELEAVNLELESKLASLNLVKPHYSDYETDGGSSVAGSPRRQHPPPLLMPSSPPSYKTQRSQDLTSDYISDQEVALSSPQTQARTMWYPTSPHSHASASPDLGIESDHGRLSSLETHASKSTIMPLGPPAKDFLKLEEENTQLRHNLQKTRFALEETLAQLTAANQHKRQYKAQLSAANQHKAEVERAICHQIDKTHSILKKARVNLEENSKSKR